MIDEKKLIERIKHEPTDGMYTHEIIAAIEEQPKIGGWIPADNPPKNDNYVLLSFANFSVPLVGRYEEDKEGGVYYVGDDDQSCISQDIIVNAWMPLPEPYKEV